MEVVEISREERDVYLIPQNFVDTGTILGGTVKLRNAVEAAVLAVGSAVPLFYLPLAFNIRLMIVIAVSVPLGVFGVVGIGGDSLTQFAAHWFRFMKRRRIVTPTPQGNLEANRHRHLRFISKRYRVIYYDDSDALPHNAQVLQRKTDRHGKLVKRQTLYDLLPIEKIENGILHTTDDRYIKILEMATAHYAGTVTRTEAGTVHYTLLYAPVSVPVVVAATAESGINPALLIMGIACALLFIAVLLIISHLLRKEPAHAVEPTKPAPAPKVYVPSGDIVLGGRNEDDDEENL